MARFGVTGLLTVVSTTDKSVIGILGSANKRAKIYDWMVGADGTPADNAMNYQLQQQDASTAGTATAVTPKPLDPADPASDVTANEDYSVEPTADVGIPPIEIPVNQRASYRWVASPGGELILAATASIKYLSQARSPGYASTTRHTLHFEE